MFVKKDLRKIPTILSSALQSPSDKTKEHDETYEKIILKDLPLSRRPAEFNGSISILCNPKFIPSLKHLTRLSLYDCQISSLDHIGALANSNGNGTATNLQDLNIGRNPLNYLPDDLSLFQNSLRNLWCDDCQLTGSLPSCVLELKQLQILRMSNNQIDCIPDQKIQNLRNLKILCLDGNNIKQIPSQVGTLQNLESLLLRKNKIQYLPEGVPGGLNKKLKLLHVSSNLLQSLPQSISDCTTLECIYANSNALNSIPTKMASSLIHLKHVNLCSNQIFQLPDDFIERFGNFDFDSMECIKDSSCKVMLRKNPISEDHGNNDIERMEL